MENTKADKKIDDFKILLVLFFTIGLAEIIAELFVNKTFIYILKPLLIPTLTAVYWKKSKQRNYYFIVAMFFAFLANIFFVAEDFNSIMAGAFFYLLYRIIVIYLVLKIVGLRNYLPIFLGSIPFLTVFSYIGCLTIDELGSALFIYIIQVLIMSFLGGFSVANYMIDDNRTNFWLFLSSLLFSIIQIILILKIYYISVFIFQPMAMILYIFAQYALYKFMILSEN
ncbi:lysoplasmalogenase family protein [Flavobacterium sp.]|uniref:lysoplasmalogenase family protein n=1 Tax=Flavobacterium sp. TaxID=239 RepID=UPI003D6B3204